MHLNNALKAEYQAKLAKKSKLQEELDILMSISKQVSAFQTINKALEDEYAQDFKQDLGNHTRSLTKGHLRYTGQEKPFIDNDNRRKRKQNSDSSISNISAPGESEEENECTNIKVKKKSLDERSQTSSFIK